MMAIVGVCIFVGGSSVLFMVSMSRRVTRALLLVSTEIASLRSAVRTDLLDPARAERAAETTIPARPAIAIARVVTR